MQVTYDFYRPWFSPKAGGKELLIVSRIMVVVYGVVMAVVSVAFNLVRVLVFPLCKICAKLPSIRVISTSLNTVQAVQVQL